MVKGGPTGLQPPSSLFLGSVDVSQPRPVAMVKGGPTGLQPPSSSSARTRTRLAAAICEHIDALLVLAGSALTTAMIFDSTSLSARTMSAFMLTAPRVATDILGAPTSEQLSDERARAMASEI